jgi:hypothetical protein
VRHLPTCPSRSRPRGGGLFESGRRAVRNRAPDARARFRPARPPPSELTAASLRSRELLAAILFNGYGGIGEGAGALPARTIRYGPGFWLLHRILLYYSKKLLAIVQLEPF